MRRYMGLPINVKVGWDIPPSSNQVTAFIESLDTEAAEYALTLSGPEFYDYMRRVLA